MASHHASKQDEHQQEEASNQSKMVFFDGDETKDGFSDDEIDKPLTWRGNPDETLSDWTVIVSDNSKPGEEAIEYTYHVHKSVLGASQRKSNWFASLYRSQSVSSDVSTISRLNFDVPVVEYFPLVLDFMYMGTLEINSGNAVALRYLANYLSCRSLMAEANEFIKTDLNRYTAIDYILEASKIQDIRLITGARMACCKLFSKIEKPAFANLPPALFEAIICSKDLVAKNPFDVSLTVSNYLFKKPETLSEKFLYALTSERIMTEVDPYSARVFLNAIRRLEKEEKHIKNNADTNRYDTKSLSLRCAKVLALEWRSMLPLDLQEEYIQLWKKESRTSSLVLVSLLASAVDRAQCDLIEVEKASEKVVAERDDEIIQLRNKLKEKDDKINILTCGLQKKENDLRRLSDAGQEKDVIIAEKQKALVELKAGIDRIRISKDEEFNRIKNLIREKDQLLLDAKDEIESKDLEIQRLQSISAEKDMMIREKQKSIGELKVTIDRMKQCSAASQGVFGRRAFGGTGS